MKLKALAAMLGWPEGQIVRDSVTHVLALIHNSTSNEEPRLITLARLALCHEQNPDLLRDHIKKTHSTPPAPSEKA